MKVLKQSKKNNTAIVPGHVLKVKINHELDKYDNVVLFPEKDAKAEEILGQIDWDKFKQLSEGKETKHN